MITIKDIAKEANVSYNTVSVVIGERSKPGRVSKKVQKRIKDIASRMGYSRNAVATNMRRGRTNVIVFISSDISQEYASRVLEGASTAINKNHFFLKLILMKDKDDKNFKASIERLMEQRPAGFIIRSLTKAQLKILSNSAEAHGIPIACVENYDGKSVAINVFSDDIIGMQDVVKRLHDLGHQWIAHITSSLKLGFAARRYQGFCQGMKKCGLALDDALLFEESYKINSEEFYAFIKKIVSGNLEATAICASSDFQALTAMNIIQSLGKRVPEDISIIGYGYLQFCNNSFPTLTTIKQPFEEMGIVAANNLIKAIQGDQFDSIIKVPTELVIKKSCGPAKVPDKQIIKAGYNRQLSNSIK